MSAPERLAFAMKTMREALRRQAPTDLALQCSDCEHPARLLASLEPRTSTDQQPNHEAPKQPYCIGCFVKRVHGG